MRVLAVAQHLRAGSAESDMAGERYIDLAREPLRDRGVVGGGSRVGRGREAPAEIERGPPVVLRQLADDPFIVLRVGGDDDELMVLGGGADQGGSADVDLFHRLVAVRAARDGFLERVEVDDDEVDRRDPVRLHRFPVGGEVAPGEDAAMDRRVQRLDPPVHHFRVTGDVGDVACFEAGVGERPRGAAARHQRDAPFDERGGEFHQPCLVGNREQRPLHRYPIAIGHPRSLPCARPSRSHSANSRTAPSPPPRPVV